MRNSAKNVSNLLIHAADRYQHYHGAVLERVRSRLYRPYEENHVFEIQSDDFHFQMSFLDYPLDPAIVQRIEARREPETVAVIKALVRRGDRVLELGGAYGYFTSIMALCTGSEGRVVSIEGTPNNFRILKGNIERNGFRQVDLHNVFLTESGEGSVDFDDEERDFYSAKERMGGANGAAPRRKVSVPAVRLSSLLSKINYKPQRLFVDLEGFEVAVFEDLKRAGVLESCRPSILFETHEPLYAPGKGLDYIRDLLSSCGYYCRGLSGNWMCHHPAGPVD